MLEKTYYPFKKICSIGLGYVGLPSATMFAIHGINVIGVDINENAVAMINSGKAHIEENDLNQALETAVASGRLKAQTTPEDADVFIITVPTPMNDDKSPDMRYVHSATRSIAPFVKKGNLVILESTSPVGATAEIMNILRDERPDLSVTEDLYFAYCPERILPGNTMKELISNSRTIGGITPEAAEFASQVFATFCLGEIVQTDAQTAEMCKLVENSYRDVNIAFANELSMICDTLGLDVDDVVKIASKHPRVNILSPGPGVGGHCLPIDPWFIVSSDPENASLIRQARLTNDKKTKFVASQIKARLQLKQLNDVAIFGISYKPDVDDPRESPSITIINELAKEFTVYVVDPYYSELPKQITGANVSLVDNQWAHNHVSEHVVLTPHSSFDRVVTHV